ncbi:MAG: hypothetical protein ACT4PW_06050, partial [Acidimicrobiia bacterium]
ATDAGNSARPPPPPVPAAGARPPPAASRRARRRASTRWWLVFRGVGSGNGYGDEIDDDRAERLAQAFSAPLSYDKVHRAGFYDDAGYCGHCDAAYCYDHWNAWPTEYGHCPRGHGKSLDPHWHPSDE